MPTTTHHVVLDDRKGEFWEGALIEVERVPMLRGRGVVTLPVEPRVITLSACAGYFKRSWGSGWPLSSSVPKMCCPMMIYAIRALEGGAVNGINRLSWVARFVPDSNELLQSVRSGGHRLQGMIRLAPDASQLGTHSGGFTANGLTVKDARDFGHPDSEDGWTIYGEAALQAPADAFFACGLYGQIPGLRVAWCAVSQSR